MAFNKYDSFNSLNDSTTEWKIRVRAQSIWKGITKKTGEFRGYNIILFDDSSERIHAFMSALICPKFEAELFDIYNLEDIDPMKTDNRFLTDVVAVIHDIQPIAAHNKKEGGKHMFRLLSRMGRHT
ncbi:hypothetical protein POM88_049755 [Heracleum sosnowskyi]|uniref:Uncharacterized protein n=1 Tax=Heracleum sosnowskyi TaxID=360622 RepID=A0AAD8GXI9_9APIA|nr:hypothetical protein POM88_049755 [Heracleum sosnowskyi]